MADSLAAGDTPNLGKGQFASHEWLEPLIVLAIMFGSIILNRRRNFSIFSRGQSKLDIDANNQSSDSLLGSTDDDQDQPHSEQSSYHSPPKKRSCCGTIVETPNSSRFADNYHSRVLQKYPFLVEMFYWILNYVAYRMTKGIATMLYAQGGNEVTQLAQDHGIWILNLEHDSIFKFFFALKEVTVQQFFLTKHLSMMTFLNRIYSLVHIPGTVTYLSWYYYAAPNHATFAIARRTMTLGNFAAFIVFAFWPCMPPRLLPKEYGFHDTVRQEHAESVWVGDGKNVNQLAAMPSLHFTYAFVIGCTFFYHSGFLQAVQGKKRAAGGSAKSVPVMLIWMFFAVFYPILVLTVIVSTANHYYLDAVVATFTVTLSFLCNRIWLIFLPAEDLLLWVCRLEKPTPTTGDRGLEKLPLVRKEARLSRDHIV